jgi:hypothetical protein
MRSTGGFKRRHITEETISKVSLEKHRFDTGKLEISIV